MASKPVIRVLHHTARTGGTVISRCLGVMPSVVLLSEIHPLGTKHFDPLRQARDWFQLVSSAELTRFGELDRAQFVDAIALVHSRCEQRGQQLILRDWSHLDFTGFPFVDSPVYRLQLVDVLENHFHVVHTITVRHPLDQLLSLRRLPIMQAQWDEERILHGFRRFAEVAADVGFLRYEDFTASPDQVLRQICERLQVPFDPTYRERWAGYRNVTGDPSLQRSTIAPEARGPVDAVWLNRLWQNWDYRRTLEVLGYEHPRPLVEEVFAPVQIEAIDGAKLDAALEQGNRQTQAKQWEEAVRCYQQVLAERPQHEWALNNLGFCLMQLQRFDWAVLQLKRALAINGKNALTLANLVNALGQSGRKFEAQAYQRRLVELEPDNARHAFSLAYLLCEAGCVPQSLFYCQRALELDPHHRAALSDYLMFLNYSDQESVESVAREHFRLAQRWIKTERRAPDAFRQTREPDRCLRIGYVSSDFFTHPVGKIVQPLIAAHDKAASDVYCYYSGKKTDYYTQRIKEVASNFREVRETSDEELERQILDDQIDVLVDLGGYTAGGNRLAVFAAGAAPVQISFLGYPNTTGLEAIDYRLTDAFCDPPGRTEHLHSERLVRLARGFLCYTPPPNLPPVVAAPFESHRHITFGSFNNTSKLSDTILRMWAEIMKRVPESRLTFKYGDRFESEWLCERMRSVFATAGVDPARLTLLPMMKTVVEHLQAIGNVDIALDTFPYQGTHTTLETLTMSVPVITLCGETYVRRASSALMMRLGLNDLVAHSPDEYVNLAVELAGNPSLLRELRLGLRDRFLASEICDVAGFVAELEAIYRRLWAQWCTARPRYAGRNIGAGT